jgi:hypothetical protein
MALALNTDTLRAAYAFLSETPPFNKWNLPDCDDVEFRVVRDRGRFGWYRFDGAKHVVAISTSCVGQTDTLIRTMAHEMIHVHEEHSGSCSRSEHGPAFKRWAAQVCQVHGFDQRAF